MRRNEVWWAELPAPAGPRPVVILTRQLGTLSQENVAELNRAIKLALDIA